MDQIQTAFKTSVSLTSVSEVCRFGRPTVSGDQYCAAGSGVQQSVVISIVLQVRASNSQW